MHALSYVCSFYDLIYNNKMIIKNGLKNGGLYDYNPTFIFLFVNLLLMF